MVDKTLEYVEVMDKMILSLSNVEHYRKEFIFYLSKDFAQGLYDHVPLWHAKYLIAESGQEFLWKGFKCKVI